MTLGNRIRTGADGYSLLKQNEYDTCIACNGDGQCRPCKGSGRSGFFLKEPSKTAPLCEWCKGTRQCHQCSGRGWVQTFTPHITVKTSLRRPTSITVASFSGAPWRRIAIPTVVITRKIDQQRGWVRWRVQTHYRQEKGLCFLFGQIVGYWWHPFQSSAIELDRSGYLVDLTAYQALLHEVEQP